jgi:hypothetical protein
MAVVMLQPLQLTMTPFLPPSLGTTQTALTDEHTKFQSTIVNLQNSFSKAFNENKINGDKRANEFETRIKEAEQAYVNAQTTMLTEFKTVPTNTTTFSNHLRLSVLMFVMHKLFKTNATLGPNTVFRL